MPLLRALSALFLLFLLALPGHAQTDTRGRLEGIKTSLDRIEEILRRRDLDQGTLQGLRGDIDPLLDQLRSITTAIEPEARAIEERLKQLGPAPEGGRTEDAAITQERAETQRRFAALDADLRQSRLLAVRGDQISDRIAERRREALTRELFEPSSSVVDPTLWRDVAVATPRIAAQFGASLREWWAELRNSGHVLGFPVFALAVTLAVLLYGPARRRLIALPFRDGFAWATVEHPTGAQRAIVAAWMALVNALLPPLAAYIVVFVLRLLDVMPFRIGLIADAVVFAVGAYAAITAIAHALLAPDRLAWRFLPVSDAVAKRAMRAAREMGLITAVFTVAQQTTAALLLPHTLTIAILGVRGLTFAIVLALGLAVVARIENAERETRARDPYMGPRPKSTIWGWFRLGLWAAAAVIAGAAILGYAAFSSYLSGQVVWITVVTGGLVILVRLIGEVTSELTRAGTVGSRHIAATLGTEARAVEQFGIVASGVLRLIAIVVAIFMLIAPWGVESRDALGWVRALFFGVQVGGITISLSAVFLALAIFAIGLIASRAVQRWLENDLLPSTRMDIGLRNSIKTGAGYVGFIVAAVIGFSYLGVDVQNLAIVAGALSVGIGFGLQSIVSNFVSGLILLAERPIKAGDWIVVGESEGYVRRINVRSTEIETFDQAALIVPNSALITGTVRNWMHNDLFGRARVKVVVPYGTDPELVRSILLDIARGHGLVTCDPEPRAALIDFTDHTMVFELAFTVTNVDRSFAARSDVRYEIVRRFAEAGISMGIRPPPGLLPVTPPPA